MIGMWTHPAWMGTIQDRVLRLRVPTMFTEMLEELFLHVTGADYQHNEYGFHVTIPLATVEDAPEELYALYTIEGSPIGLVVVLYRNTQGRYLFGLCSQKLLDGALALSPLRDKGATFQAYNLLNQTTG